MQDLEQLKAWNEDSHLPKDMARELIVRCESAEAKLQCALEKIVFVEGVRDANIIYRDQLTEKIKRVDDELKELREQKPVTAQEIIDAVVSHIPEGDIDDYYQVDMDWFHSYLNSKLQSRDSAVPVVDAEFTPSVSQWDAAWSAFGATEFEDMHKLLSIDHINRLFKMFLSVMQQSNANAQSTPANRPEIPDSSKSNPSEFPNSSNHIADPRKLVSAQQSPAVAVPDAMESGDDTYDERASGYRHGWNDCRAAIMAASQDEGKV